MSKSAGGRRKRFKWAVVDDRSREEVNEEWIATKS